MPEDMEPFLGEKPAILAVQQSADSVFHKPWIIRRVNKYMKIHKEVIKAAQFFGGGSV